MWLAGALSFMETGSEIRLATRSVTIYTPFLSKNCPGGFLYVQPQVAPDLINENCFSYICHSHLLCIVSFSWPVGHEMHNSICHLFCQLTHYFCNLFHIRRACCLHLFCIGSLEEYQRSFHLILSLSPRQVFYSLLINFYYFRSVQDRLVPLIIFRLICRLSQRRFQI